MSLAHPFAALTLRQWDGLVVSEADADIELVEGLRVVASGESFAHREVCGNVYFNLRLACPRESMRPVSELHVLVADEPAPTIRRPDVMVLHADAPRSATRMAAEHVLLAVEVVSPTSTERDWITKPRAYARAGIPAMLIIDPQRRAMALLTQPVVGGYAERSTGEHLTWRALGHEIDLSLADFLG